MSGKRRSQEEVNYAELLAELKKRPERPIQALCEDSATLEGLIDLLVLKGVITEEELSSYLNQYMSVITALVMLLVEKGAISNLEMEKATLSYHFALRNCRPNAGPDEIFESRRAHLKKLLEV